MRTIQAACKEALNFPTKETSVLKETLPDTLAPSPSSAESIMPLALQLHWAQMLLLHIVYM